MSRRILISMVTALWSVLHVGTVFAQEGGRPNRLLCFLQPFNDKCIDPKDYSGPFGVFEYYFNSLYPWLAGVAAGIALLMVVVGGIQMIMAGGDQGKRDEGVSRLKAAIFGLLILIFSTMLMQTLNPLFYK